MLRSADLPVVTQTTLDEFVAAAKACFADDLESIVLFGSAAEGQLRPTSDVNLIVLVTAFRAERVDGLREIYRVARAVIRLEVMFLVRAELPAAVESFAVKFADVRHRHQVLFGPDPFEGLQVSRAAEIVRLRQVLLNLALRLRQRYVLVSLRDEQAGLALADAAGPLRASALVLCELWGQPAASPREALEQVARKLPGDAWGDVVASLPQARQRALPPGTAAPTLFRLAQLAAAMHTAAQELSA